MAQVLALTTDRELRQRVSAILAASDCSAVTCGERAQFQRHAAAALSAVIAVPFLAVDGWIPWLAMVAGLYSELPVVVVTAKDADNLRLLAQIRVHAVLYPAELDRLPALVRRQPFEEFFAAVDASIRAADRLPLALRRAMRYAVNQVPAAEAAPGTHALAPTRTVKALATRLGYTLDYLSHLAGRAGIPLGPLLAWCIALRGIELRLIYGLRLDQAAWRLGFEHPSGLSDLCLRALGMRPSDVRIEALRELFDRFDETFPALRVVPEHLCNRRGSDPPHRRPRNQK